MPYSLRSLQQDDKTLYTLLRREIVTVMKKSYPGINPEISEWKGQTITDFQEDLRLKVKGRISEKWFYTHMKSPVGRLPRIDILNLLSQYAGYKNWDDFRHLNAEQDQVMTALGKTNRIFLIVPLLILAVMAVLFVVFRIINTRTYHITFIDADTGDAIMNTRIQADLLLPEETAVSYVSDNNGEITFKTDQSRIIMAVTASCYQDDTIKRILKKFNRHEQIRLKSDPYSMMIQYLANTNIKAWQSRREQLDKMISENALIYQIPDQKEGSGMELYNKWEFIDKLTMPSSSLRSIEILNTRYERNQIKILRFRYHISKR